MSNQLGLHALSGFVVDGLYSEGVDMGNVIILGHGGFRQADTEILVGPGQSVTFYADAGQDLLLPAKPADTATSGEHGENWVFDYESVNDALALFATDREVFGGGVTYNFHLQPISDESWRIAESLNWGGELLSPESGEMHLCTGDATTCPTPALREKMDKFVKGEEGGEDVPDEKWIHTCDGILGTHKSDDILWVSCTGFRGDTSGFPPDLFTDAEGPGA